MAEGWRGLTGACYPTRDEALADVVATTPPFFYEQDGCVWRVTSHINDGAGITVRSIYAGCPEQAGAEEIQGIDVSVSACEYIADPFRLDLSQGSQIAVAILGVWIVAWAWKALARTLQGGVEEKETS